MKVWLKFLIGAFLGVTLGFLLPPGNQAVLDNVAWLGELAIRIGRYVLVPILVFSLTIAVYELRQDGQFWGILLKTFAVMVFSSVFVVFAGILAAFLFLPSRIPIDGMVQAEAVSLNTAENILQVFPSNMFAALLSDGLFLLPICVFAFFLGMGLSYDRNYTKPVISLVDSLSRIFYHIASFFSEILGFVMIVLSAYWAVRFHGAVRAGVFRDILLLLGIFGVVVGFGILPAFLYLLKPKVNPWKVLYGSLGQALAGFFSGDINFTLPLIFRHLKENLGVRRRSNAVTVPLFAIFGRAGSAVAAAMAFMVVINSYSSLGITAGDVFTIAISTLAISFLLAGNPGNGAYVALAVLSISDGRFEAGYLILRPIAFYLIAVGTFLDVMINSVASYAIASSSGFRGDKETRHFI
ncbi:MAG: cation:dicarboxylase symporter family transporter [Treponema sp.]|nr:cation:dicarboxylase symporter family transporter [Treponema sp.]